MLWGPNNNLDFWTARAAGLVAEPEQRAVSLLAKHSEERRFSVYCRTGQMAAMGNMTKRIYLIRRFAGVLELDDGHPKASWCMNGGGRHRLPETDHVVAMKLMIEGEEYVFRTTGNPSPAHRYREDARISNPYEASFGGEECRGAINEDLHAGCVLQMRAVAAKDRMKSQFDRLRSKQWLNHKLRIEHARHGSRADFEESQKAPLDMTNAWQIGITNAATVPVFGGFAGGIRFTGANLYVDTVDTACGPRLPVIQGAGQVWPPLEQRNV